MSGAHPPLGPELRLLAQALLDKLDPAVRVAAAAAMRGADGTARCTQVWCPVCALAALVTGEQHPLLGVVAEHSTALLAVVRALVDDGTPAPDTASPAPAGGDDNIGTRDTYQSIPVTIEPPPS